MNKPRIISIFTVLASFILFAGVIMPSGHLQCHQDICGRYYGFAHGHDALWHLSVSANSFQGFPPLSPIMSGTFLSGYNYGFDLLLFAFSKFGFDPSFLYFKLLPVLWFCIFLYALHRFTQKFTTNSYFFSLNLFLIFITSSFAYLITLKNETGFDRAATLITAPVIHLASNPPFAYSLVLVLVGLILLKQSVINYRVTLLYTLLVFTAFALKFYGGVVLVWVALLHLAFQGGVNIMQRVGSFLFILSVSILAVFVWYSPANPSSQSEPIFAFAPFALVHRITEDPSLFYLENLTNARYFLHQYGLGPRLFVIEVLNLTLYLFFNYGIKLLGLFYAWYLVLRHRQLFDRILLPLIIILLIIPTLFVQKGEWWNIAQFGDYGAFLLSLYTARFFFDLNRCFNPVKLFSSILVLGVSSLAQLDTLRLSYLTTPTIYISIQELEVLNVLKAQKPGVVGSDAWRDDSTRNTPYLAALGGKPVYLDSLYQLRVMGADYQSRVDSLKQNPCLLLTEVDYYYTTKISESESRYMNCPTHKLNLLIQQENFALYSVIEE